MVVVACTCHRCGEITVPAVRVQIMVRTDNFTEHLTFRCPLCGAAGARPIGALERHALGMIGATEIPWEPPAELDDPDRSEAGPLTVDPEGASADAVAALGRIVGVEDFLAATDRRRS